MSTTLEAELLLAAERTDTCAAYARQVGNFYDAKDHTAEAARLRQRAAWVREIQDKDACDSPSCRKDWIRVLGAAAPSPETGTAAVSADQRALARQQWEEAAGNDGMSSIPGPAEANALEVHDDPVTGEPLFTPAGPAPEPVKPPSPETGGAPTRPPMDKAAEWARMSGVDSRDPDAVPAPEPAKPPEVCPKCGERHCPTARTPAAGTAPLPVDCRCGHERGEHKPGESAPCYECDCDHFVARGTRP